MSKLAASIAKDDFVQIEFEIQKLFNVKSDPLKIYESILQTYLFCGFPAVIETLRIFKKYFPKFKSRQSKYETPEFKKTGEINCKLIYKKNFKKLIDNMSSLSPDLKEWMLIEGYGKVMGRKGLSLIEREIINVSVLAAKFYENQLHSHIRGCMFLGVDKNEMHSLFKLLKNKISNVNYVNSLRLLDKIYS